MDLVRSGDVDEAVQIDVEAVPGGPAAAAVVVFVCCRCCAFLLSIFVSVSVGLVWFGLVWFGFGFGFGLVGFVEC